MNIALIGAGGFIGSALLSEALARGHQLSALVTRPERLTAHPQLRPLRADVFDTEALAAQLAGHEAVLSAFSGHAQDDVRGAYLRGVRSIISAVQRNGQRLLIVGGAGSLDVAPGLQLLDTPEFPQAWRATAEGARDALALLREQPQLDWTMLSPPAQIEPGPRQGGVRIGRDQLLLDAQGRSRINTGDYAAAMLDELEQPRHHRQRFTVAY